MALEINIPDSAWSSQEVTLDQTNLKLELLWNTRNNAWHINIYDINATPILEGIKLTENVSVTGRYTDKLLPDGNIWCVRYNPQAKVITRDNLGRDFLLIYFTEEEERDVGI